MSKVTIAALVAIVIVLCLSTFLAGAYTASNSVPFQNCFTPQTPCMKDR